MVQCLGDLPGDIIFNILTWLPVKPLCRFKSVCKPWLALITDPHFIRAHLNRSKNDYNNQKLIFVSRSSRSVYSVDCQSPDHTELEMPAGDYPVDMLGSFNGIVLLQMGYELILWNPSIRTYMKFSQPKYPDGITTYGLGYDFGSADFKVVRVVQPPSDDAPCHVHVFSSKLSSWKRIGDFGYEIYYDRLGPVLNGLPHWVVGRDIDRSSFWPSSISNAIVCFDVTEEKFKEVPQPNYEGDQGKQLIDLGVLCGSLCVVQKRGDSRADVWVMKEYGVKESWTKLFVVPNVSGDFFFHSFKPLCYTKDGEVVMVLNSHKILIYNPQNDRYKEIRQPPDCTHFDVASYVESLVSLHIGVIGKGQMPSECRCIWFLHISFWRRLTLFFYIRLFFLLTLL